ncbi:MAG: DUF3987 domain-containing protein [Nitrospinota bacterium]|nr:DUF3987 domain-containing protein [Nitrospinota bacterium]
MNTTPNTTEKLTTYYITSEVKAMANKQCNQGEQVAGIYPYVFGDDQVFNRLRIEKADGDKRYIPLHQEGGRWYTNEPKIEGGKPLYRLPELLAADHSETVWIVEGEKCAEALAAIGLLATTSGGATSTNGADWEPLKGRRCVIWPDNDKSGQQYAKAVAAKLEGLAASVEVVDIARLILPEKGDCVDWLSANPDVTNDDFDSLPLANPESKSTDWPAPVCFDHQELPDIPIDSLPGWLRDMVEAVSEFTETPQALSALFGVAVVACAVQGKMKIEVKSGYKEPLSLFVCPALESGNRKTAIVGHMTAPLVEWEAAKEKEMRPDIERSISERKTLEAAIEQKRKTVAKLEGDKFEKAQNELAIMEATLPAVLTPPRVFVQDITPEKLGAFMADHNERAALFSDEAGIFGIMAGRYSKGAANLDIFLQGHAGGSVRVDRGSRPSVILNQPALTIGISPQPSVLHRFNDTPEFRGRGLLARFIYALPRSPLGTRSHITRPIPDNIKSAYHDGINSLLNLNSGDELYVLYLSDDASIIWHEYAKNIELDLMEGMKYEHIRDWAAKLPGAVARIAGLFHCVQYAQSSPWENHVNADTMKRSTRLMEALAEHALAAFNIMGADPDIEGATRIWRWIERMHLKSFTKRDAFKAMQGYFNKASAMDSSLKILADRYIIRDLPSETRPGRPSQIYEVNPALAVDW